jgi:hypothetical protein
MAGLSNVAEGLLTDLIATLRNSGRALAPGEETALRAAAAADEGGFLATFGKSPTGETTLSAARRFEGELNKIFNAADTAVVEGAITDVTSRLASTSSSQASAFTGRAARRAAREAKSEAEIHEKVTRFEERARARAGLAPGQELSPQVQQAVAEYEAALRSPSSQNVQTRMMNQWPGVAGGLMVGGLVVEGVNIAQAPLTFWNTTQQIRNTGAGGSLRNYLPPTSEPQCREVDKLLNGGTGFPMGDRTAKPCP